MASRACEQTGRRQAKLIDARLSKNFDSDIKKIFLEGRFDIILIPLF